MKWLAASDIDAFLNGLAARWKPASRKVVCTSLRSYLRFRTVLGDDIRILSATLPAIANWPRRHPPKVLTDNQLKLFFQTFDLTDPVGLRDYAIARCLLDLALRSDEAAHLTLEAVDWRNGTVALQRTKSQRMQYLPLPVQTGEALARYLREGRPSTDSRALFIRHRAPWGVPLDVPYDPPWADVQLLGVSSFFSGHYLHGLSLQFTNDFAGRLRNGVLTRWLLLNTVDNSYTFRP